MNDARTAPAPSNWDFLESWPVRLVCGLYFFLLALYWTHVSLGAGLGFCMAREGIILLSLMYSGYQIQCAREGMVAVPAPASSRR